MIYHWCREAEWSVAGDAYLPAAFDADGFTHCSFVDQVTATATALYRGRDGLVVLCIDEHALPVVVEDCYEVGEPYPHIYGPIPRDAVRAVLPFPCLPDGSFALPDGLAIEDAPVGRLLARLVGAAPAGTVAELGPGTGQAATWMASTLRDDQRLVTTEMATGSWRGVLDHAPFTVVFVYAPQPKLEEASLVIDAVAPGGVIVLDDFTPRHLLPAAALAADGVRRVWLGDARLSGVERQVAFDQSVIVARRQ